MSASGWRLKTTCSQHIRASKAFDAYDIDMVLTIVMEQKLDEVTKLKWMEYSNDSKTTPPYSELLKFLNFQAQHFESTPCERKQQTAAHKSYASSVKEVCVACGKGIHPLGSCGKSPGVTREECWDIHVVIKGGWCKNCLNPGHSADKCRAPHHTLVHKEADTKPEEAKEPSSTTYAASSR